ncbi:MAG TPA: hypothetical protein VHS58_23720 [Acetobacteraceae bacterium]|jgi:hypothetical protein|nr:hypothetical protein [Acetobacteraceae bacterium]
MGEGVALIDRSDRTLATQPPAALDRTRNVTGTVWGVGVVFVAYAVVTPRPM